ncbi:MAG: PA14 domain-containing protein [Candidatus Aenigmarchaeota archaeon]|nr:PA14 domain-containing protein [Candidatus Aenigmarchaeota archaeon]
MMKRILLALAIGCLIFMDYALADQWHPASEIRPGTFGKGDYKFPGSLNVTGFLNIGKFLRIWNFGGNPNFDLLGASKFHFIKDGGYLNPLMTLDNAGNLWVKGGITAASLTTYNQICPTGWSCHIKTWDIAAQSAKLYGYLDVSSNLNVGGTLYVNTVTGLTSGTDLTLMPPSTSKSVQVGYGGTPRNFHVWGDTYLHSNLDVGGKTTFGGPLIEGTGALIADFLDAGDIDKEIRQVFCMEKVGSIDWTNKDPCNTNNKYFWMVRIYGYLYVPTTGSYTFYFTHDDGIAFHVDGQSCYQDWNPSLKTDKTCTMSLNAGWHKILIQHFQGPGPQRLKFEWSGPGFSKQLVPASNFAYPPLYGWGLGAGIRGSD